MSFSYYVSTAAASSWPSSWPCSHPVHPTAIVSPPHGPVVTLFTPQLSSPCLVQLSSLLSGSAGIVSVWFSCRHLCLVQLSSPLSASPAWLACPSYVYTCTYTLPARPMCADVCLCMHALYRVCTAWHAYCIGRMSHACCIGCISQLVTPQCFQLFMPSPSPSPSLVTAGQSRENNNRQFEKLENGIICILLPLYGCTWV